MHYQQLLVANKKVAQNVDEWKDQLLHIIRSSHKKLIRVFKDLKYFVNLSLIETVKLETSIQNLEKYEIADFSEITKRFHEVFEFISPSNDKTKIIEIGGLTRSYSNDRPTRGESGSRRKSVQKSKISSSKENFTPSKSASKKMPLPLPVRPGQKRERKFVEIDRSLITREIGKVIEPNLNQEKPSKYKVLSVNSSHYNQSYEGTDYKIQLLPEASISESYTNSQISSVSRQSQRPQRSRSRGEGTYSNQTSALSSVMSHGLPSEEIRDFVELGRKKENKAHQKYSSFNIVQSEITNLGISKITISLKNNAFYLYSKDKEIQGSLNKQLTVSKILENEKAVRSVQIIGGESKLITVAESNDLEVYNMKSGKLITFHKGTPDNAQSKVHIINLVIQNIRSYRYSQEEKFPLWISGGRDIAVIHPKRFEVTSKFNKFWPFGSTPTRVCVGGELNSIYGYSESPNGPRLSLLNLHHSNNTTEVKTFEINSSEQWVGIDSSDLISSCLIVASNKIPAAQSRIMAFDLSKLRLRRTTMLPLEDYPCSMMSKIPGEEIYALATGRGITIVEYSSTGFTLKHRIQELFMNNIAEIDFKGQYLITKSQDPIDPIKAIVFDSSDGNTCCESDTHTTYRTAGFNSSSSRSTNFVKKPDGSLNMNSISIYNDSPLKALPHLPSLSFKPQMSTESPLTQKSRITSIAKVPELGSLVFLIFRRLLQNRYQP